MQSKLIAMAQGTERSPLHTNPIPLNSKTNSKQTPMRYTFSLTANLSTKLSTAEGGSKLYYHHWPGGFFAGLGRMAAVISVPLGSWSKVPTSWYFS